MIKNTFILIPGVGEKTEEYLWKKGILTWDDLKRRNNSIGLSVTRKRIIKDYLSRAEKALNTKQGSFFAKFLPQTEYWRLFKQFHNKTLYLDIETTGLSQYYDAITIIGTFDGQRIKIFMKDNNLDEISEYLRNYEIIVTFNGKMFDIPFIKKEFPDVKIPPIHIDLRFLLKSLGITGPLKEIEKKMNIPRAELVREISSRDAAVLWSRFVRGYDEDLEKLLLYNIYDVIDLQVIMHSCYQKKIDEINRKMNHDSYQQKLFETLENINPDYHIDALPKFNTPKITIQSSQDDLLEAYLNDEVLIRINRKKIERIELYVDHLIQEMRNKNIVPISVGIDLSGSEGKGSGFCILQGNQAHIELVKTDDELISKTVSANPTVISIDSPLSLPKGRDCEEDTCECRRYGITRECERILKKRGINVYPCLIKSMQKLTMRGIKLTKLFEEMGYEVIESYPGAAQDILGMPRKRVDLKELEIDLTNLGIKLFSKSNVIVHDELDALTSALVGFLYLADSYEAIGNIDEGYLIIPAFKRKRLEESGGA